MTKTTQEGKPGLCEHPSMATPAEFQTTQGHPRGLRLHTTFGEPSVRQGHMEAQPQVLGAPSLD